MSLLSARALAVETLLRLKTDINTTMITTWCSMTINLEIGRFTAMETSQNRKLSHPWHGPYRILHRNDPDITAKKVYFPDHGQIQVHQQWVTKYPLELIAGYYQEHIRPRSMQLLVPTVVKFQTLSLPNMDTVFKYQAS